MANRGNSIKNVNYFTELGGGTSMSAELVELEGEWLEVARKLTKLLHAQGMPPGGGAAPGSRWFGLFAEEDGSRFLVAAIWIHLPGPFAPVFRALKLPEANSYFVRRICKFAPGDWLVPLLTRLGERLAAEGKEALVALGLPRHSNAVYKLAGFEHVGDTPQRGYPVFVKWLQRR
jgi:hypothetical protein